jgi:hypothetical protein
VVKQAWAVAAEEAAEAAAVNPVVEPRAAFQ